MQHSLRTSGLRYALPACFLLTLTTAWHSAAAAEPTEPRTWNSLDGKFSIEATLLEDRTDSVLLQDTQGRKLEVPLVKLSVSDRKFVIEQRQPANAAPAAVPQEKHPVGPTAVYWQYQQFSKGGKFCLDFEPVTLLFVGMSLPRVQPVKQQIAVDGPKFSTSEGATGTGKYAIRIKTAYDGNGVAKINVAMGGQQHTIEILNAGKLLIVNDKSKFEITDKKKTITIGSRGTAKEL